LVTPATPNLPTNIFSSTTQTPFTQSSYSNSLTATGAASSASQTSGSSGTSTGVLVGGIAAGVIGLAAVAFALVYFLRRCGRREQDEDFDSDMFKRQSVMLRDDAPMPRAPSREQGGFTPRPPTMIERHLANATPVSPMGPQYGHPYGPGNFNAQYNDSYNPSGIMPGQVLAAQNPFQNQYGGAPVPSPHDHSYNNNSAQPAYLSRQPSGMDGSRRPDFHPNDTHYVDMRRTSVTQFQAAQYDEISRRLDIPSPAPGPVADSSRVYGSPAPSPNMHLSPPLMPSPFEELKSPVYRLGPSNGLPSALTPGAPIGPPAPTPEGKRPDTVYTVYGDDDAYGGI